jgi:ribonuclease Z
VFSLAKPKLAVYSHIVFLASDKVPRATVDDIVAGTRETYDGPLQVGVDLMSFAIGVGPCPLSGVERTLSGGPADVAF